MVRLGRDVKGVCVSERVRVREMHEQCQQALRHKQRHLGAHLNVFDHDCDPLCMNGAEIRVFKQVYQERFCRLVVFKQAAHRKKKLISTVYLCLCLYLCICVCVCVSVCQAFSLSPSLPFSLSPFCTNFLECKNGHGLPSQRLISGVEILCHFSHHPGKREFADQELCAALVLFDFAQRNCAGPETTAVV